MKTTTKALMLITVVAIAMPTFANEAKSRAKHYNTQQPSAAYNNDGSVNMDNDVRTPRHDSRWLGMRSTTKGMKTGAGEDANNRSTNSYIMNDQRSNVRYGASQVVKH